MTNCPYCNNTGYIITMGRKLEYWELPLDKEFVEHKEICRYCINGEVLLKKIQEERNAEEERKAEERALITQKKVLLKKVKKFILICFAFALILAFLDYFEIVDIEKDNQADFKKKSGTTKNIQPDIQNEVQADTLQLYFLRAEPRYSEPFLSKSEVRDMLKKYDFYCIFSQEITWGNSNGKGIVNKFILQKNGIIVFDRATGLMWQQSGSENYDNYEYAKSYIAQLNNQKFCGYDDWRLPTIEEAMSLIRSEKIEGLFIDPIFDQNQTSI